MRLSLKWRCVLATVVTGLVLAVVFGSQYVRQVSIDPGPFREWAIAVLSLTDSAEDQWLTAICVGVYFVALMLLFWRLAGRPEVARAADSEIGDTAGWETCIATSRSSERVSGLTSAATKVLARLRLTVHGPEVLLIVFVGFAVAAYASDYQRAYYFSDFLTLFAGVTFGRAVLVMRWWRNDPKSAGSVHALILPWLVLLLALAAVFHPDMGRTFRYREELRWMGPYFNPNTFGLLMGMGMVLAAGQLLGAVANLEPRTLRPRLWHWLKLVLLATAAVVCGIGLVRSYSRGAWMGSLFGLGYLAWAGSRCSKFRVQRSSCVSWFKSHGRPVIPAAILLVSSLLVLAFWNFRHTEQRMVRRAFSVGNVNDFSWRNRVTTAIGAWQMMTDKPVRGFGWNRVENSYTDFYRPPKLSESFAITLNDYSVLGVTLGLPALLCMLGYVAWRFGSGHRAYFSGPEAISSADCQMAVCRAGFLVLALGFAVEKGIFYIALGAPFWMLLELGAALPVGRKASVSQTASSHSLETETLPHPEPPLEPRSSGRESAPFERGAKSEPTPVGCSSSGVQSAELGSANSLPDRRGEGTAMSVVVVRLARKRAWGLVGLLVLAGCVWFFAFQPGSEPDDPVYRQILAQFQSAHPMAVSVSPNGRFVLTKTDEGNGFKLTILDRESGQELVSSFSRSTQRALTWRPDSQAIAYQDSPGMNRPLYVLDVQSGKTWRLNAPVSRSALPPLRWSPNGKKLAYFHGDWRRGRLLVLDMVKENEPIVVKESLSANCDFVWSPNGSALAFTTGSEPGTITLTALASLKPTRLTPLEGSRVRELAWSPDGRSILVTARGEADEYFKVFEVEADTGKSSLRAEAIGDIENPVWLPDGGSFLYHVLSNGITVAVLGNRENPRLNTVGPIDGVIRITHVTPDGSKAYARYASLTAPPALLEIPLRRGEASVAYAPPKSQAVKCPKPEFIVLKSQDGTAIPAYHWNSVSLGMQRKAVLIVVHGGLHTQTYPTWEAYLKVMLDRGCDVIAVNFRGSSGYGHEFERMGGELKRVQDVLAAREYAVGVLNLAPGKVYLTGISHGAGLIATAAAQGEEIGGLVLVSWVGPAIDSERHFRVPFKVIEIHGEVDPTMSPKKARATVESYFAPAKGMPKIQFRVFEDEGHFFYKTASWAQVYWETLKLMELE
jgi:Tol biopolymer transport system component/dienelactone hydrolase